MIAPNPYVSYNNDSLLVALLVEGMLHEIEGCAVRVIKICEVRAEPYC